MVSTPRSLGLLSLDSSTFFILMKKSRTPNNRFGYARVSSLDQNADRQLDGLDFDRLFTDKASGKDTQRPQLGELLGHVREGDTVVVHSMDRLARNLDDLRPLLRRLIYGRQR